MYLIFVAFRNYGYKNTKTFPIIVHFLQKKCDKRAKRRPNRRMSERRAKLAWTIPSEKEEDEIKRAQSEASHGVRHLGHSSHHTQAPVPVTTVISQFLNFSISQFLNLSISQSIRWGGGEVRR